MKFVFQIFLGVLLLQLSACAENLKDYKAYDVTPNADQLDELMEWRDMENVDFWATGAAGRLSRVMVPPNLQSDFERFLTQRNVEHKVHIEDVGEVEKVFEAERISRLQRRKERSAIDPRFDPNFGRYWDNEEIDSYCRRLATMYPQLVQREYLATSFEGREIFALKISRGGFENKPIIFMDGGMHAREWVSQASIMYLLHRMVELSAQNQVLLDNVSWIIIPNLNPDGYFWSYTQSRMWRQNRNRINSTCVGVDLNRNWRFTWRLSNPNSCGSLTYGAEAPHTEVEVYAMDNYMLRYRQNVRMYVTVHSFGDMVLYPWSYPGGQWIWNYQYHYDVGMLYANAIRTFAGRNIIVGNSIDVLGTAFGVSDDHMSGEHNITLSYTLELTRGGITGFDFPEAQLGSLVQETFLGYEAFARHIGSFYNLAP